MEIPVVPVIIKRTNPEGKVETVTVMQLFAVPILYTKKAKNTAVLLFEPRVATMINGTMHLLTLSPDREDPETIIYETWIEYVAEKALSTPGAPRKPETHVGKGGVSISLTGGKPNDQSNVPGASRPPQDADAVSRPANDGGDEVSR